MDIVFADSFFESLKKLSRHETWWYKTWSFFRYDIGRFFKNIYLFRKELYNYHPWDSSYCLGFLRTGLDTESKYIEKYGLEVDESRLKKVEKMNRACEILKLHENGSFIDEAEKILGYECDTTHMFSEEPVEIGENNKKIYDLSNKIEEETWEELFVIFKGQNFKEFDSSIDWEKQFDGSGLRNWWD